MRGAQGAKGGRSTEQARDRDLGRGPRRRVARHFARCLAFCCYPRLGGFYLDYACFIILQQSQTDDSKADLTGFPSVGAVQ